MKAFASRQIMTALLTAALLGSIQVSRATAQAVSSAALVLKPGATVARGNLDAYAKLLTPGLGYAVSHGMRLKIVAAHRIEWPPQYQAATEQHAAQAFLDDRDALRNYVAGLPFPNLAPDDPKAALKIAYDWRWGPFIPEQIFGTNLGSRTFRFSSDGASFVPDLAHGDFRNEYICNDAVAVRTSHRLDPTAIDGGDEFDWKFRDDQCGPEQSKVIAWLFSDPGRMPDSWFYSRDTRRWLRLSMPDTPTQSCTYTCTQMSMEYAPPQTGFYDWSLEGKRTMLGCFNGAGIAQNEAGMTFGEVSCEPREVYILHMEPKQAGSEILAARVYIDAESFVYLGGEIFRDKNPDLSAAFWIQDHSAGDGARILLAADLYVADDRWDDFLWLDAAQRITFAGEVAEKMFNPKAEN